MKITATLLLLLCCRLAAAAAPQPGLWYNPAEPGRGYSIDSQNETLVLAFFGYDEAGRMQWYYADGPLGCGGTCWSGRLLRFDNGQPLNGTFRAAASTGSAGTVSISFASRIAGTLTLPGGRRVAIERFNHSAGDPPQALLGQWSYTYLIGSSWFVDVYVLNTLRGATSTGTGVVTNAGRTVAFEYQATGSFAGRVVGFHFSSTGTVLDQYLYQLQLEEGRGTWVSPVSFNEYGMSALKMYTGAGTSKSAAAGEEGERPAAARTGRSLKQLRSADPELGRLAAQMWERIQQ